jgi:hypothetical protein
MVWFMAKWAIASIPAMIILLVIGFLVGELSPRCPAGFDQKRQPL